MGKDKLVYAITAGKFVPDAATTDFSLVSFAYFCTSLLVTVPLSVSIPAEVFRLTQDAALAESWTMNARGG